MSSVTPISPERSIFDIPVFGGVQIAPDATKIAWVRSLPNRETSKTDYQIWIADADGTNARQLTQVGTGNTEPAWSPDSRTIAYVSRRDGDRPYALVLLGLDGGESRILTTHDAAPSGLAWSPDGTTIAYTKPVDPDNPDETPRDPKAPAKVRVVSRVDYKHDGIGFVNDVRSQLFVLDVATQSRRQLTATLIDHVDPRWSPDGRSLAVGLPSDHGMHSKLGIVNVETAVMAIHGDDGGLIGIPSWSPDGSMIAFAAQQNGRPHSDLTVFDVEAGSFQKLVDDPDFLLDGGLSTGSAPVWLDSARILVHGVRHGRSGLWSIDSTTGVLAELGIWDAIHVGLSVDRARTTIVQAATSLQGLVGLVSIDVERGVRTVLIDEGAAIFGETPVAQWEEVSIERAGFTVSGWLYKPADFDEAKSYPLILDIHGGPHLHFNFSYNYRVEMLASNGFLVLVVNPRGSTSYGREFAEAVRSDWGGGDWNDLEAMLDHVLERPYIDKDRTGIGGYSYGGYMTSWVIGHTDRFKAAIVGAPCFDLESFFGTSDIGYHFGPAQHGVTPWEDPEKLASQSPSTFIHNAVTPTLIAHGEADERCPIGQGEQLFISLKKLGVETEFARYPGAFHLFHNPGGNPSLRLDYYVRSLAWFKHYLGDPA